MHMSQECNEDDKKVLTMTSPYFPVLNTKPFPLAITQALSKPFGNTYIASSPRRRFASTNSDKPAKTPVNQNEGLDIRVSITARWRFRVEVLDVRIAWRLCLKQKTAEDDNPMA